MTNILLVVGNDSVNMYGVIALIAWSTISIWWIGKIDYVQYFFPYYQKKKRRLKGLQDFEENFETLRKKEGLTVSEYEKAVQYRSDLKNLVNRTTFGPFHRYGKHEDIYQRDSEGNKIPDPCHILRYDDDGSPVYRGKIKEPGLMKDRNELRVLLIAIFLVIMFIYFFVTSAA